MLYVIEGLDGSGKSTQTTLLTNRLQAAGYKCRFIHFPRLTEEPFGKAVAMFLRGEFGRIDEVNPYLVALLFACDQWQAKELLANNSEEIIILDRYYYSNIAYQAAKIEDDEQRKAFVDWLNHVLKSFGMVKADAAIYLDVPQSFRRDNLAKRQMDCGRDYLNGCLDIHEEDLLFQERVGQEYLKLCAYNDEFYRLDCAPEQSMLSIDNIAEHIFKLINHQEA